MTPSSKNNAQKTRNLLMPIEANQVYGLSEQSWKVLTEVTFPTAKTPEAIMMALDYCKARKLDIFKKPVHVVPMWSAALGRSVETVWPSIMEIQTTASRTGLWAGMDRPVWGPDVTHTFTGRFKDDNDTWQESTVTVTFPEWVAVTVYRLVGGQRCAFTEEVYWKEAYSTAGGKNSQLPTAMWIKRPKGQLSKCGKAASLRAAFPEECGYAAEEMDGKSIDDMNEGGVINGSASRIDDVDDSGAEARYTDSPLTRANNHAWEKALIRANIIDFRWHDLRHTWASWHVQNGTPLHVLKELGGWSDLTMVLRYAHLSSKHLEEYAGNSKSCDKFTTRNKNDPEEVT